MHDATTDSDDLDLETTEGDSSVPSRLDRVEGQVGDIGKALDLASKLALEQSRLAMQQNDLLRQVVSAISTDKPSLP